VVRTIRQWLDEGVIVAGEALPPEREMAERLGVTRNTVRRALQVLRDDGFLAAHGERTRTMTRAGEAQGGLMRDAITVFTMEPGGRWTDPTATGWSGYIAVSAMQAIRQAGHHVMGLHPERIEGRGINQLIAERPFGVVMTEMREPVKTTYEWACALRKHGIPVVLYGDAPEFASFDHVASDHEAGSLALVRWLASQGHRRILPVWTEAAEGEWFIRLRAGYREGMREAGLKPRAPFKLPLYVEAADCENDWHRMALQWLEPLRPYLTGPDKVDVLMFNTDGYVFPAAMVCRMLGLEPNRDVVLTGYDNYWRGYYRPELEPAGPLATVDKRHAEIGASLVNLLLERISGRLPATAVRRVVEPELIVPVFPTIGGTS